MYQEVQKLFHLWPFYNFEQSIYSGNHPSKHVEKKKMKKNEKEVMFFSIFETLINIAWLGSGILLTFLHLCLMV